MSLITAMMVFYEEICEREGEGGGTRIGSRSVR
jgi:hypothetical protein